jgi:hypothetical protein
MLLGGFLWLGGRLALKASEINNHCAEITLKLPEGASMQGLPYAGHESWIVTARDGEKKPVIYRFDPCGRLLQTVYYTHS